MRLVEMNADKTALINQNVQNGTFKYLFDGEEYKISGKSLCLWSDQQLNDLNLAKVETATRPDHDNTTHRVVMDGGSFVSGKWVYDWNVEALTAEELASIDLMAFQATDGDMALVAEDALNVLFAKCLISLDDLTPASKDKIANRKAKKDKL